MSLDPKPVSARAVAEAYEQPSYLCGVPVKYSVGMYIAAALLTINVALLALAVFVL